MLQTDLRSSTTTPDEFFGGLSQKGYIKQWSPNLSDRGTVGAYLTGVDLERELYNPETIQRLVGYRIVELMPALGLKEMCETLITMYDFYRTRAILEPKRISHTISVKAKIGTITTRPEFYIDPDEE